MKYAIILFDTLYDCCYEICNLNIKYLTNEESPYVMNTRFMQIDNIYSIMHANIR